MVLNNIPHLMGGWCYCEDRGFLTMVHGYSFWGYFVLYHHVCVSGYLKASNECMVDDKAFIPFVTQNIRTKSIVIFNIFIFEKQMPTAVTDTFFYTTIPTKAETFSSLDEF